ncbi:hypothetical protein MMC16_006002 [Acarospora aff. strigata]|nr:hypothetical protein [Acarospora aff. strigata]
MADLDFSIKALALYNILRADAEALTNLTDVVGAVVKLQISLKVALDSATKDMVEIDMPARTEAMMNRAMTEVDMQADMRVIMAANMEDTVGADTEIKMQAGT